MLKKISNTILVSLLFFTIVFNKVEPQSVNYINDFKSCEVSVFEFKKFYYSINTNYYITDFETSLLNVNEISCHMLIKDLQIVEGSNVVIPIVGWSIFIYVIQILLLTLILIINSKLFIKSSQVF